MIVRNFGLVGLSVAALVACSEKVAEPTSAPVSTATAPTPETAPAPVGTIILDGEGLKIASAASALIAFGTPRTDVEAAVGLALGSDAVASENPDCPTGPATVLDWGDALQVVIQNGAFVGWRADDGTVGTASGIHVGSTRAQAEAGKDFTLPETTLDAVEITVDGVGGFLAGADADSVVEQLFSGDICMAR